MVHYSSGKEGGLLNRYAGNCAKVRIFHAPPNMAQWPSG